MALLAAAPARYLLGVSVDNVGSSLKFASRTGKALMPTSVAYGGTLTQPLGRHEASLALGARTFTQPKESRQTDVSVGGEFAYLCRYALRAGYQYREGDMSGLSVGLGARFGGFNADVAYRHGLGHDMPASALLSVGYQW